MIPSARPIAVLFCIALLSSLPTAKAQRSHFSPPSVRGELVKGLFPPSRIDAVTLDRIIQPITTVTEYADGSVEYNNGNGFVVGDRFFTVNHNLAPAGNVHTLRRTSFVNGVAIRAVYESAKHDLAEFRLPAELCREHCNALSLNERPTLEHGQEVFWLRKFDGEVVLKTGRVLDYAWIGDTPKSARSIGACEGRMVVQVDTPFLPGSSGSPVIDAKSGQIVGIIQGSFRSDNGETGFFKPLSCLAKVRPDARPSSITESL